MNSEIQLKWENNTEIIKNKFKNFVHDPLHTIIIEKTSIQKRIIWSGITVAESNECLILYEKSHDPVYYFPPYNVKEEYFTRTTLATYCPYKGDATYWNLSCTNKKSNNCVWAYPKPMQNVLSIENYFSFYLDTMGKDFGIKII